MRKAGATTPAFLDPEGLPMRNDNTQLDDAANDGFTLEQTQRVMIELLRAAPDGMTKDDLIDVVSAIEVDFIDAQMHYALWALWETERVTIVGFSQDEGPLWRTVDDDS